MKRVPPVIMDAQTQVLYQVVMDVRDISNRILRRLDKLDPCVTLGPEDLPERCDLDALRRKGY